MSEIKYLIPKEMAISVSARDIDKLLARRDANCAMLFLYLLRSNGTFTLESASKALGRTSLEIRASAEALEKMGLLEIHAILEPAEVLPEVTTEDIKSRTMDSSEFSTLISEVQQLMGRILSGVELKLLFGIYDYLSLPPEVILMLVSHCIERTQKRLGLGKLPTLRSIEKEAYAWANREIMTIAMADEHLKYLDRRDSEISKIKTVLGIHQRDLSTTEKKYVESWVSLGFECDALAIAYDKTVMKTGGLQWKYMNSILNNWHSKNLHTVEEISEGDKMPLLNRGKQNYTPQQNPEGEIARMEKLIDKMKNN